jgi:hypothetical protein
LLVLPDAEAGRYGLGEEWEPSPQVVLERCAKMLGMMDGAGGILAVRRGSNGSYILDCQDMDCVWEIPRVPVAVTDPTGKLLSASWRPKARSPAAGCSLSPAANRAHVCSAETAPVGSSQAWRKQVQEMRIRQRLATTLRSCCHKTHRQHPLAPTRLLRDRHHLAKAGSGGTRGGMPSLQARVALQQRERPL